MEREREGERYFTSENLCMVAAEGDVQTRAIVDVLDDWTNGQVRRKAAVMGTTVSV